jgi:hypothetical protein
MFPFWLYASCPVFQLNMFLNLHDPTSDQIWVENVARHPFSCRQVRYIIVMFGFLPQIYCLLPSSLLLINSPGSTLDQLRVILGISSRHVHHTFALDRTSREPVANISRTYREDIKDLARGRKVKNSRLIITMNDQHRSMQKQIKAFVPEKWTCDSFRVKISVLRVFSINM